MNQNNNIDLALSQYVGEPCRICGDKITGKDVKTTVFAGYSIGNTARAAHKECWDADPIPHICVGWAHP